MTIVGQFQPMPDNMPINQIVNMFGALPDQLP